MVKKYRIKKEGGSMVGLKKEKPKTENDIPNPTAKTAEVAKAIIKSNKKHSKMMSMLSR